jgi:hypothetical protein
VPKALAAHLGQRKPPALGDDVESDRSSDSSDACSNGNGKARAAREKAAADARDQRCQAQQARLVAARRHQVAALSGGCLAVATAPASGSSSSSSSSSSNSGGGGGALELVVSPRPTPRPAEPDAARAAAAGSPAVPRLLRPARPAASPGFAAAVRELGKWEDVGGRTAVAVAVEWRLRRRPAKALLLVNAALAAATAGEGGPNGGAGDEETLRRLRAVLYGELGWAALEQRDRRELLSRFPPAPGYRDF